MSDEKVTTSEVLADDNAFVRLVNVNKIYDKHVHAVFDFNLDIKKREFIVFVGPSGCGKSTTLRMIAGLEDISSGELYIDGKYANDLVSKDRDIAMVFQNYALYPHMTVYDNIAFGLKMKKMPKDERKSLIEHYMQVVNLTHAAKQLPHELSGGMKQRVAIARALAPDPKIILMDEPFGALDSINRHSLQNEVRQIWQKTNKTILFITHDVDEAILLGSRIIVLNGQPGNIVLNEKNPLTAHLTNNSDCRDLPGYNELRHRLLEKLEQTN